MKFLPTDFPEVFLIEPEPRGDDRGFMARMYCEREFGERGLNTHWVQQNQSRSLKRGTVRGMHFQAEPHPEVKLVRCVAGHILDVVVDVRPGSPTRGRWQGFELSSETLHAVYVPVGFAHGFQCLEDHCDVSYLVSDFYNPSVERGLHSCDPEVGIAWPLPVINLSPKDQVQPMLRELK